MDILDKIKISVKREIRKLAVFLDKSSNGRITPNSITIVGLIAHVFIALLIASGVFWLAGLLLIVFGLFDSLDGELARLQNRESARGMLLDTITDRVKEILLYVGVGLWVANYGKLTLGVIPVTIEYAWCIPWIIAACGLSILISYINAWGEVLLTKERKVEHKTNKIFRGGIMSFENRMATLIIGLLIGKPMWAVVLIVILGIVTAIIRFNNVWKSLE